MSILALLAVFTERAPDSSGRPFAIVYAIFLVVQTGLWTSVLRQDRYDHPEYLSLTRAYATGMGLSVVAILASAFPSAGPRLTVWAGSPSPGSLASPC
jgi:low temperature requirement protein LtrA